MIGSDSDAFLVRLLEQRVPGEGHVVTLPYYGHNWEQTCCSRLMGAEAFSAYLTEWGLCFPTLEALLGMGCSPEEARDAAR